MLGMLILKNQKRYAITQMSEGVLIYAFNSNEFDYVKSATFAATQAKKYLNLPVTLVTNIDVTDPVFDTVIRSDDASSSVRQYRTADGQILSTNWFNQSRTSAYNTSPYDKTLLIDADYFMYNDSLKVMYNTNTELACFDKINDIMGQEKDLIRLNEISIPMQWATVVYFTKCPFAEGIFTFMEKIKQDWEYYSLLYSFRSGTFRNDYALSIALQALSGYSTKNFTRLPGKLHTIFSHVKIQKVEGNKVVCYDNNELTYVINTNIHCMNKLDLTHFYAPT